MDGHERDALGGFILFLVLVGLQRDLAEEVGEEILVGALFVRLILFLADGLGHLLHVLLPRDALCGTVLVEFRGDAAALDDQLGHLIGRAFADR